MVKKLMCIKHAEDCYALQESVRFVTYSVHGFSLNIINTTSIDKVMGISNNLTTKEKTSFDLLLNSLNLNQGF